MLKLAPLDPRSKLVASLAVTVVLVSLDRWEHLAAGMGVLLCAAGVLHLWQAWLRLMRVLGFAVVSFFAIAWLSFDLPTALSAGLSLMAIGTVFFVYFQTTTPERLSNSFVKMGVPYAFTFVLTAAMQFVDVLARRAVSIRDAQRARGIPLDGGWSTLRNLPALLAPLLIQAFKLADELAEAMEARGFGAPGRTFRDLSVFRPLDWIVVAASAAVFAGLAWLHLA